MAIWHGYLAIENLNLNGNQRNTLIAAIRKLGPVSDLQPARLCHWRTRLDGEAAIFEAAFNEDNLMVARWKEWLAGLLGVNSVTVDYQIGQQSFATGQTAIVIFARNRTNYLRVALFGGIGSDWQESGDECRGYLHANMVDWEIPID